MKKRIFYTGLASLFATAVIVSMRVRNVGEITGDPFGTAAMTLLITTLAILFIAAVCGRDKQPTERMTGGPLYVTTFGAVFAGVSLLVTTYDMFINYYTNGIAPYPNSNLDVSLGNATETPLNAAFVWLLLAAGVLGGLFFISLASRWFFGKQSTHGILRIWALTPVLWAWVRTARFELSFLSSQSGFSNWADILLMLTQLFFLLVLARYVATPDKGLPKSLVSSALMCGIVTGMCCATQVYMIVIDSAAGRDMCDMITLADYGITLLAFCVVFGQSFPDKDEDNPFKAPNPIHEGPRYLIPEEHPETVNEETEEEKGYAAQTDKRDPIELENLINELIDRTRDAKK